MVLPAGGHAVYIDMDAFFHDVPMKPGDFGGVGFCIELLHHYGIRWVDVDAQDRERQTEMRRVTLKSETENE